MPYAIAQGQIAGALLFAAVYLAGHWLGFWF